MQGGGRAHNERCRKRIMEAMCGNEEGLEKVVQDQRRMDWRKAAREEDQRAGAPAPPAASVQEEKEAEELFGRSDDDEMQGAPVMVGQEAQGEQVEPMQVEEQFGDKVEDVQLLKAVIGIIESKQWIEEMIKQLSHDIAEVYSPKRVTLEAAKYWLQPGDAMDLATG